jgi:outer membrane receptor protein involved in Fe transport
MPRNPGSSRPIAVAITIALWVSSTARAQEPQAGLEEVVVTAQRVETDIQKTPVAVTALSGDFLRTTISAR